MQMFDYLEVSPPAGEGQVSGTHKEVAIVVGAQNRNLGVKDAGTNVDGLHLVILADPGCTLLAQARPDTFDVGQDQSVMPTPANEGVEENGLEKG
jgi:hypothetical protein